MLSNTGVTPSSASAGYAIPIIASNPPLNIPFYFSTFPNFYALIFIAFSPSPIVKSSL